MREAERSAGRAGGYCWLEHPSAYGHCTKRPHTDRRHIDFYTGRMSPTDTRGKEWME
ncbi:hypothetical protein [Streptomyces sp. enrichment culture]|uniref:hypothetical protein n=1 Tax=Streptomyces sp. enrichment culture TaxID=1795815 RepID=UPI003F57644C